jgi:hypothetical protein
MKMRWRWKVNSLPGRGNLMHVKLIRMRWIGSLCRAKSFWDKFNFISTLSSFTLCAIVLPCNVSIPKLGDGVSDAEAVTSF